MAATCLYVNLTLVHPHLDHGWPFSSNCAYYCGSSRSCTACIWWFSCCQASSTY